MITKLSLVLLALAVAVVQPWALAQEKEPALTHVELKKGDHILFYGDSLTDQARGPKGWVTIVRQTLKEKHPDLGLEVSTFAIGGYCIVDRVKRVEKEVLAKKPTIVVIQGGVPDALRYKRDQFKTGLEELIERLQKANVRVVVCSCTSLGEKHDGSNRIDKNLDDFADVARQVAKDKKLPLNDLRKVFKEYWTKHNTDNKASGILTHDGNHFNDTGNKFVAEQMLKMFASTAVQPKLDKLDLQAKKTVEQFMKAMTAHDIEATMKVVDVPFFWDGVENIKDREKLKNGLEKIFARNRIKGLEYDLKDIWSFSKLPENAVNEKDRKLLSDILEKTDRLVLVLWRPPGRDGLVAVVRIREGTAKIVGFRD